jgi:hypothetical protein
MRRVKARISKHQINISVLTVNYKGDNNFQTSQINQPYIHGVINIQIAKNQKNNKGLSNYKRAKVQTINLESSSLAADELVSNKINLDEMRKEKEKQDKLSLKDTRANKSQSVKHSNANLLP